MSWNIEAVLQIAFQSRKSCSDLLPKEKIVGIGGYWEYKKDLLYIFLGIYPAFPFKWVRALEYQLPL